jgi:hypothetical protein
MYMLVRRECCGKPNLPADAEKAALLSGKAALDLLGDSEDLSSWTSSSSCACDWAGVECGDEDFDV